MPDIGFLELMLVAVIAFLVLGPERMPELLGQVGRLVKKGKHWFADIRRQIDEETALSHSVEEVKKSLNSVDVADWNRDIMKKHGEVLIQEEKPAVDRQDIQDTKQS